MTHCRNSNKLVQHNMLAMGETLSFKEAAASNGYK